MDISILLSRSIKLALLGAALTTSTYAQQWTGSTTGTGLINRQGDITAANVGMPRVTLGFAFGNVT